MELKKNLLEIEKQPINRKFLIIFFVVWLIVCTSGILFSNNQFTYLFNLVLSSVYIFVLILNSYGISLMSLFGKAYVDIDKNRIIIKPKVREEKFEVNWSDIKKIEILYNGILFIKKDENSKKIKLSEFIKTEYRTEVEEILKKTALEKEIDFTKKKYG